ncbi:MAG TPA: ATP-binding protein, partial [Flavobacteriaceae bacterium]|nr:ATP-binding protein [Flavobacteriaceae bacterium]
QAEKKDISLVFDHKNIESVFVVADQERIQQVLTNLILNSIKYGKKGGSTEVSIQNLSKTKVLVKVKDNGEGMEEKHLTRIFERFYRIDTSGSRHEGGSGLGLSIVKHIIEAHKEKVMVESTPNVGSEFSFTLEKYKP